MIGVPVTDGFDEFLRRAFASKVALKQFYRWQLDICDKIFCRQQSSATSI